MTDRKQINIKIKSDKAEKWQSHIEDNPQYSSMTDLIRQSVEKEIAGGNQPTSPSEEASGKEIAEMKDMVKRSQQQLTKLKHTVSDLQEEIEGRGPPEKHIRSEIFAALPDKDVNKPQNPKEIADKIGGPVDQEMVSETLRNMSKDMGVVKQRIGNDAVLYEKEVK